MTNPIEFFEIQELFARKVAAVSGIAFEEALLLYTSYYKRIGVEGWELSATHPLWRCLIENIGNRQSPAEAAFELSKVKRSRTAETTKRFGCMGFDCRRETVVMHFRNDFSSRQGPLSKHHVADRVAELREMFEHVARHHPEARFVEGLSWLYNYDAYRRLFPREYTTDMELVEPAPVRLHSTWGQFIDSSGGMYPERTETFKQKVGAATSLDELLGSFPFRVYKPRADIGAFYSCYGVARIPEESSRS
jgi:hypothetical protein